jgi:hypothetical protein
MGTTINDDRVGTRERFQQPGTQSLAAIAHRPVNRQVVAAAPVSLGLATLIAVLAVLVASSTAFAAGGWSGPRQVDPWFFPASFSAVSCSSASLCVAVDGSGAAVSYHGGSWSAPTNVNPAGLISVSCAPSASFCVAIGGGDAATYNGTSWSAPVSIDADPLGSVSCASESFCVAVDTSGRAITYNGSWSAPVSIDSVALESVSCHSASFCAAVDEDGRALTFGGSSWSAPVSVASEALNSVSCASESLCVTVDTSGQAFTFGGSSWSAPTSIDSGSGVYLDSVSCAPATSFCIAVDDSGRAFEFTGGSWGSPVAVEHVEGQEHGLGPVSCPSASFCIAADNQGNAFTFSGSTWTGPQALGGLFLSSVSCVSSFCAAVDYNGRAVVYDGTSWDSPVSTGESFESALGSISCSSTSFCVAVGGDDAVTYNGFTWSGPVTIDPHGADSVSCVPSFCIAVGGEYAVTYNGASWETPTKIDSLEEPLLRSVSCASSSFCVAVDDNGNALTYKGGSWGAPESLATPFEGGTFNSVSCAPGSSFCVAVDEGGGALKFNGTSWSAVEKIDSRGGLTSVSCPTSSFCVAVDSSGRAFTYNGSTWGAAAEIDTHGDGLSGVSCTSSSFCVATDLNGTVLTYPQSKHEEEEATHKREEEEAKKKAEEETKKGLPPVNSAPPTITGTDEEGQTLTEHHGTWTNTPTEYSVQWERCNASGVACSVVASGSSYVLTGADVGSTVRASETASNGAGPGSPADSEPTPVIVAPKGSGGGGSTSSTDSGGSGGSGATATTAQVVTAVVAVPVVGQRQTVSPVSGTVLVRVKGASGFVALSAATSIAEGSEVEATDGRVLVTVATPTGTETAEVYGGRFVVEQEHIGSDETRFVLSLPLTGCPRLALPRGSAAGVASAKHGPKSRHLWVSETGGSWGTNGRYVSTTVEGTHWLTQDECNQSEVQVVAGKVKVNDLVTHKTKTLTAGQHYTAKRR